VPQKPSRSPESLLEFDELLLQSTGAARCVLLAVPRNAVVIDRDRLQSYRARGNASELDLEITREVAAWPRKVDVVLFRAMHQHPEAARWSFAYELTSEELDELGVGMVRSHVHLFRALAKLGVLAFAGIEFGEREFSALRRGTERVTAELERSVGRDRQSPSALDRLDLWLLDHLALWSTHPLKQFVSDDLPGLLALMDRRTLHVRRMLEKIPPDSLELGALS